MGSNERRERERLDVRAKILDAAREIFAAEGYDSVTMRKVADKIEYTPTTIYLHFADKLEMVRELIAHDMRELAAGFQKVLRVEDPVERLREIGHAYVQFGMTHPNHYRLMFMTPLPPAAKDCADRGIPERDAYALVVAIVQSVADAGRLRPEYREIELVAQMCWAAMHGIVSLHIAKGQDDWVTFRPLPKVAAQMIDIFVRELASSRAAARRTGRATLAAGKTRSDRRSSP